MVRNRADSPIRLLIWNFEEIKYKRDFISVSGEFFFCNKNDIRIMSGILLYYRFWELSYIIVRNNEFNYLYYKLLRAIFV